MKGTGLVDLFLKQIESFAQDKQYLHIRTDTYEDNIRMQNSSPVKLPFPRNHSIRGIDKRRAFEKILMENTMENPDTEHGDTVNET